MNVLRRLVVVDAVEFESHRPRSRPNPRAKILPVISSCGGGLGVVANFGFFRFSSGPEDGRGYN